MSTFNGQNGSSNSQGEPHKSGRNGHTPGRVQGSPTDELNDMRHNSHKLCNLYATYAKPQNGHDNANYMANEAERLKNCTYTAILYTRKNI